MATRDFVVRGASADLFDFTGPELCVCGAAGTGKTVAALMKLHMDSWNVPGVQSLVVRQTHASLVASTLVAFEQFVARDYINDGRVKWFGGSGSKPAGYRYPNGSMIMVGGMDNPGKVLSMSLDRILVDESNQISVTAYETLLTRLRGSAPTYKQIVTCTNPDHPDHWLKQRADDPDTDLVMLTSMHRDNPYLFNRDGTPTEAGVSYMRFLEGLTGLRRARYLEGRWVGAEGLVFDDWRDDTHVVEYADVPECHRSIWSIDFGYSNPFVFQRWVIDGDGRMYLTHEIHKTQTLVEDHAREIKRLMAEHGWAWPEAIVCDHDAEDRATLERHLGRATVAAKKAVGRGVQLTQSRMRKAGDGRPRIYVVRDAVHGRDDVGAAQKRPRGFLGEVKGYVWQTERGTDGIPKEVPKKEHDHAMDAARYAVAHLDWHEAGKVGNPAAATAAGARAGSKWGTPVGR